MSTAQSVIHSELDATLGRAGLDVTASEVHGIICGSVCNQMKTGKSPDLRRLLTSGAGLDTASLGALQDQLEDLLRQTVQNLHGGQDEFRLLLPEDDESMAVKTRALIEWCRGYLLGLLAGDSFAIDELGEDSAELARDMVSISEMDTDSSDAEDSEWDLFEIQEYVRIGVQFIFEGLYAELHDNDDSGTVH